MTWSLGLFNWGWGWTDRRNSKTLTPKPVVDEEGQGTDRQMDIHILITDTSLLLREDWRLSQRKRTDRVTDKQKDRHTFADLC